ncbi:thioredoxin domain-containing protein [Tenacibaculum aiptasiae]|uniref:Thioredoxin domain-containing protein n=1 Tax=Tenacibaculum aiptasiae TaxID=426481 RepID=A0A7J5AMR6_9FLAO|nr:thioredoxin domain-containing protein [Tenacibaculum aiptasiae]KAB1158901.1 thioredoxin domain-containing protein [Tenacibaculum aiptasiae]
MKKTLIYQIQQLLSYNRIDFDKTELAFQIESHPSYPSLHAITGVLSHFDIDNLALTIPINLGVLKQLPTSFLAQIETEKGESFVVVNKDDSYCRLLVSDKKKYKLTYTKFLEMFTGVIVVVEKTEFLEVRTKKNNFDKVLLISTIILFIGLLVILEISIPSLFYFALSLVGVFISSSIIKQEEGSQTILGNTFCSDATDKKDCDAVIGSKGALIFNRFKLSNISLLYFIGLTFNALLLFLQGGDLNILYLLSFFVLPITIYSIYYQAVVVKKWCLLCLGIVVTLWVQAIITFINSDISAFSFSIKSILLISIGFLASVTLWSYLSRKLKSLKELSQTKIDYFRFKRNFNLFNALLKSSEIKDTTIINTNEVVIGNENALLNITIITNPFCGHCKEVHKLIENIYRKYPNETKITIRFYVNIYDKESDGVKVTLRLLELFDEKEVLICLDAMHDIYDGMKTEDWLNKWGSCYEKEKYLSVLTKEVRWCKNNEINFTPEILINGRSFPKEYDRSDLVYFIQELAEDCIEKNIRKN